MEQTNFQRRLCIYLLLVIPGMIWMGLFMAPGLPLLNLVKLIAIFYIKSWAVLVTNVPHETVFKVSANTKMEFIVRKFLMFKLQAILAHYGPTNH